MFCKVPRELPRLRIICLTFQFFFFEDCDKIGIIVIGRKESFS